MTRFGSIRPDGDIRFNIPGRVLGFRVPHVRVHVWPAFAHAEACVTDECGRTWPIHHPRVMRIIDAAVRAADGETA